MPKLFLAKTEPSTYSIQDFEKERRTLWDGVHNFQAINTIKNWKVGDLVLIYHSVTDKAIVGMAKVVSEPFENTKDPRKSWAAELDFVCRLSLGEYITLNQIKNTGMFNNFVLIRNGRLSVMECPPDFCNWIKTQIPILSQFI